MTTIVIGAGPAGLAAAAMLQRTGEDVIVLERGDVGAAWCSRYDRLHLHTVRWLSCLPGYRMPRSFGKWRTSTSSAVASFRSSTSESWKQFGKAG